MRERIQFPAGDPVESSGSSSRVSSSTSFSRGVGVARSTTAVHNHRRCLEHLFELSQSLFLNQRVVHLQTRRGRVQVQLMFCSRNQKVPKCFHCLDLMSSFWQNIIRTHRKNKPSWNISIITAGRDGCPVTPDSLHKSLVLRVVDAWLNETATTDSKSLMPSCKLSIKSEHEAVCCVKCSINYNTETDHTRSFQLQQATRETKTKTITHILSRLCWVISQHQLN